MIVASLPHNAALARSYHSLATEVFLDVLLSFALELLAQLSH
jgi:hypothetical protein